jgi:serine/threonine-protein kinase
MNDEMSPVKTEVDDNFSDEQMEAATICLEDPSNPGEIPIDDSVSEASTICAPPPTPESSVSAGSNSKLEKGLVIGGYKLEKLIGTGAMAEVWMARRDPSDPVIALKIMNKVLTQNPMFVKRFTEEVKNTEKLNHPNILSAFDSGNDQGFHFMAMQFVDGEDLDDKLVKKTRLPEKEALGIIRKIAEALAYGWNEHKMIHRDLKPSNIMLTITGTPILMDMGIAKSLGDDAVSLTMTGTLIGTPNYMSPEQARADKDVDFRVDIYALGLTLYNLVTGMVPFQDRSVMAIIKKVITAPLEPANKICPEVSEMCTMLIQKMTAKKREDRYSDWETLIMDIDRVLEGKYDNFTQTTEIQPEKETAPVNNTAPVEKTTEKVPFPVVPVLIIGIAAIVVIAIIIVAAMIIKG